jgi:LysM repeat protein
MRRRRHRSPARWLAPLALLLCAFAVYSVLRSEPGSETTGASTPASTTRTAAAGKTPTQGASRRAKARRKRRAYTIQAGDTLSAIAERTGVSLERIQELNPAVDARALRTGQRIRLGP